MPKPKPVDNSLDDAAVSRVIEMAWEDRTPFEAIHAQFGRDEAAVCELMRQQLKPGSYRLWRRRVRGRKSKHAALQTSAGLTSAAGRHPRAEEQKDDSTADGGPEFA